MLSQSKKTMQISLVMICLQYQTFTNPVTLECALCTLRNTTEFVALAPFGHCNHETSLLDASLYLTLRNMIPLRGIEKVPYSTLMTMLCFKASQYTNSQWIPYFIQMTSCDIYTVLQQISNVKIEPTSVVWVALEIYAFNLEKSY